MKKFCVEQNISCLNRDKVKNCTKKLHVYMFKGIEQLGRGRNFTKKQTKSVMWNHAK